MKRHDVEDVSSTPVSYHKDNVTAYWQQRIRLRHINLKMSLCLTKYHAMKTYWGVDV